MKGLDKMEETLPILQQPADKVRKKNLQLNLIRFSTPLLLILSLLMLFLFLSIYCVLELIHYNINIKQHCQSFYRITACNKKFVHKK